jgi:hypothetical protein
MCVHISRVSDTKSTQEQENNRVSPCPIPCVLAWVGVIFTLLAHPFLCPNNPVALALLHMSPPNPPPPLAHRVLTITESTFYCMYRGGGGGRRVVGLVERSGRGRFGTANNDSTLILSNKLPISLGLSQST